MVENYNLQQKQRYYERQVRKYKRLEAGSLDPANVEKYKARRQEWQARTRELVAQNPDVLRREYAREKVRGMDPARKAVAKTAHHAILDEKDVYAINLYKSAKSYQINSALRGEAPMTDELKAAIDSIDRAIEKLPEYKGVVRRSITDFGIEDIEAFWSQHTPGARITFPAYTSSGTEVYDESFPIQYVIQSKTGRDMREYNPGEFEVLFKRGTEFNVSKVDGNTIFMEEV